jgi:hypothetical protein
MAKPRKTVEPQQGDPAPDRPEVVPSGESLGDQLLREARAGHAEFVAGWKDFMEGLCIRGQPVGARKLREVLLREGIRPENNELSQGIIATREARTVSRRAAQEGSL